MDAEHIWKTVYSRRANISRFSLNLIFGLKGSTGDGRLLLSKMESKELGVDDCAACSQVTLQMIFDTKSAWE